VTSTTRSCRPVGREVGLPHRQRQLAQILAVEREDVEGVELDVSIVPVRVQRRHDGWSAVPDTVTDRANAR
jgi:hypothetical protein